MSVPAPQPQPQPQPRPPSRRACPARLSAGLRVAVLVLLATFLPWSPAWAAEAGYSLGLVEVRLGDQVAPQAGEYLREVIAALQKEAAAEVRVLAPDKLAEQLRRDRDQVPPSLTPALRRTLSEARKAGIRFLDDADAARAVAALHQARLQYQVALAAPGADEALRREYLDVLAQLATAHVVGRDKPAATEVLRQIVLEFGAKANVTDDNYRPDVVELFHKVGKEAGAQAKARLEVSSEPAGAHILLHGVDRGVTPATLRELTPGSYTVRLQAGAAASALHRVQLVSDKTTTLAVDIELERHLLLEDGHVGLRYPDAESVHARLLHDGTVLARELGVDRVAGLAVVDGALQVWLLDPALRRVEASAPQRIPPTGTSTRVVAQVLNTLLGERRAVDGADPEHGAAPTRAWYRSVPGLVCGVAGLAALGAGVAYAPNFTVREVHSEAEKDQAETGRVVAATSLAVGGVLTALSVFFFVREAQSRADAAAWLPPDLPPGPFGSAPVRFAAPTTRTASTALTAR